MYCRLTGLLVAIQEGFAERDVVSDVVSVVMSLIWNDPHGLAQKWRRASTR